MTDPCFGHIIFVAYQRDNFRKLIAESTLRLIVTANYCKTAIITNVVKLQVMQ